ncbi:MAG: Lrp/AsnC family transcriptional regulator [archaeon]|nr:Lrp/AsnC family transcriptional regulator [Candidatus Bathyarchaeum sp.]
MARTKKKEKMNALLNELLIDSSRSDRELGKIIGVSQPTVSRTKKMLVEKGLIQGFSAIPNFYKIGYELMALTLVKIKSNLSSKEERQKGHNIIKEWMNKQNNVIFSSYCRGLESDAFIISFHPNYKDFDDFIQKHNRDLGYLLNDVKSALVNLDNQQTIKSFNFKHLAENMKQE